MKIENLNSEVTNFLDELNHPFSVQIEVLRHYILSCSNNLSENIKWNGPNYCFENEDRITMRVQPTTTKQLQIILHCGAKKQEQPKTRLIPHKSKLLVWKENDRAVITFKKLEEIEEAEVELKEIIVAWISAVK